MESTRAVFKRAAAALICAAALCPAPAAWAAKIYPSAGSTSAAFLKLPVGARAAAMGGAFSGVPGDPFSIHWNPAGLAYAGPVRSVGFFHNEYFQGLGQEALAYSAPARGGGWGLGLNYFYAPKDMERRSGYYEDDPLAPISPSEGKFGAYDLAFSAGYGRRLEGGWTLGGSAKVIRQSIDDESGSSTALDLGALRSFRWRGGEYTAGFAALNLGPGIKFVSRRYGLPAALKAGLSRRFEGNGALAAVEVSKPVDNYPSLSAGMEYPLTGRLALRSGYRWRLHGNELGAWSGFSAGAGVAFDGLTFDYAFSPFGALGNSHRFSVNLRFGLAPVPAAAAALSAPAAAAMEAPEGYAVHLFRVSPRPLTMSTRGVRYGVAAVSETCGLYALSFTAALKGEAGTVMSVAEGMPAGELLGGYPEGVLPLKVWQPGEWPGNVQGDIRLEFRAPRALPGAVVFLYRSGDRWKEAPASPAGEDAENAFFSASAPRSTHYSLGVRLSPAPEPGAAREP